MTNFIKRRLTPSTRQRIRELRNNVTAQYLKLLISVRWYCFNPRSLPRSRNNIVVTLTSYSNRFPTLVWTLKCLLLQTVKPERVVLWVGNQDRDKMPRSIEKLTKFGLEIRGTKDIRSFTKIIPSLHAFPDKIIVTADDDIYYPSWWLGCLISQWSGRHDEIVCHRAHLMSFDQDGALLPYNQWRSEVKNSEHTALLFPTGVSGILYPPRSLYQDVTKAEIFQALCPTADDVWLYWMGRMNNVTYRKTNRQFRLINWPSSQKQALSTANVIFNENDPQIERMLKHYPISFSGALKERAWT